MGRHCRKRQAMRNRFERVLMKFSKSMIVVALFATIPLAACGKHSDELLSHKHTVCVTGYNEYERKLNRFWLDEAHQSGCFGNPSGRSDGQDFGGGGGFACGCTVTPGQTVKLYWKFAQSKAERDNGVPQESRTIDVTIPQPQSENAQYLRVYFRKNGTADLQWVDDMGAPTLPPTPGK
ncbi:hypothetical protein [Paraburkholderia sp. J69-2]|uniref:hypothetical protein n=2 Tax=unclassified Paraburkholderia TaxID=2615204 RepID=UPI002AB27C2F|nr:hypothetical protein [Paraburkholderia sp. J69-2]